jgi:hypothetical protein
MTWDTATKIAAAATAAAVVSAGIGGCGLWVALDGKHLAQDANDLAQRALANASPAISVVAKVGTLDSNGKNFAQIPQRTLSIGDIKNGGDWLQLTFENAGARKILIDEVGIVAGNNAVFNGSQIAPSSAPCGDNSSVARGCSGSTPFTVEPASRQVVFYPLFAVADWLEGANGGQDEELQAVYTSKDPLDKGKPVDALVKITPSAP